MSGIFSNNCVLIGDLESFCLVCSIPLPGEEDVLAHLRSPKHSANLKPITYFEKYKDDLIKKVKSIYFCEVCNMTFSTAAKVGIHVTEETHVKGKRRQLKRHGKSIIFQKDTLIEERAWNGLVEDTCVLCNTEFDDCSTHMSEVSHSLNVVRSTVTIDDKDNIYRKVDGGYQCLTCNKVTSDTEIFKHLNSAQHKAAITNYDNTKKDVKNIDTGKGKEKEVKKENEAKVLGNKETSKDNTDVKAEISKLNVEVKALTDNPCPTDIKALDPNSVLAKAVKKPALTEEVETHAKQHNLSVDKDTNALYCRTCDTVVPPTMNNVTEHVAGKKHKDKLKQSEAIKLNTQKLDKVRTKDYLRKTVIVETMYGRHCIINDMICIEFDHYFCLSSVGKIACEFCRIDLTPENVVMHLVTQSHANIMQDSWVITSLEGEFVRQINSVYHCGYCGQVEKEFAGLVGHLASVGHKQQKSMKQIIFQRIKYEESNK